MPDYDLTNNQTVKVTLYGNLSLDQVVLLYKVQKQYIISKEQSDYLKKDGLIEGRYPRIYISSNIAKITNNKINYMERKGLDNKYYIDYIKEYLQQFETASRKEINELIYPKLPSYMTKDEKNRQVKYLLTKLRKNDIIINIGSDTKPIWILKIQKKSTEISEKNTEILVNILERVKYENYL